MKKSRLWMFAAILLFCGLTVSSCKKAEHTVPIEADATDFAVITDVVPDAILEIRYYSTYNFVGARVDGYLEPVALMTKKAADSLRAVSDDLKQQGYRLKIYDAYRPQMAVSHFVRWAEDLSDTAMKPYFYPNVDKSLLFKEDTLPRRAATRAARRWT